MTKERINDSNRLTENLSNFDVLGHSYPIPLTAECSPTKERILFKSSILFSSKGYDAVSIRDIADSVGITSGAFYNHFESKEKLMDVVLDQAREYYLLYFKHLDECLRYANSFADAIEIIFQEPVRMRNEYTSYLFSLVMTEQLRNKRAGRVYTEDFLGYGVSFIAAWLDRCVENGWAKPFDTHTVAHIIINSVMAVIINSLPDSSPMSPKGADAQSGGAEGEPGASGGSAGDFKAGQDSPDSPPDDDAGYNSTGTLVRLKEYILGNVEVS
ncbi:MAG: TetR/AcrR family transcriptional regulator [Clostridiales Family XIII bacterium]|nr:TetR/AcrR family transcriptional regulator [Clostridiales Family XIII bacterium]